MLFIEIAEENIDLTISNQLFELYGIINFSEDYDKRPVAMLKN